MAERALATAFVNIVPGTKDLEGYLKGKLATDVASAGDSASRGFSSRFSSGLRQTLGALGVAFGAVGVANFTRDILTASNEGKKVDATLGNITKSMGLFGNKSDAVTQRLKDFATTQIGLTGIDDDVIKSAQAKLMTFSQVGKSANVMGGNFDKATKLAMDLSAAGFGSVDSAAVMLGKALQDPIAGVTALQRVGVSLSQQQKDQVKKFMEAGDAASAQKVILDEVARQVGGTAEASATATDKMKAKWEDFKQGLGDALQPLIAGLVSWVNDDMLPAFQNALPQIQQFFSDLKTAISDLFAYVQANRDWLLPLAAILGGLAVTIKAITTAIDVYKTTVEAAKAVQAAFNAVMGLNPWVLLAVAIAAVVAGLVYFFTQTELGQQIWQGFVDGLAAAWNWLWTNALKPVFDFIAAAWNFIFNNVIKPIVLLIVLYVDMWGKIFGWLYTNAIKPALDAIGGVLNWLWGNVIKPVFGLIGDIVGKIGKTFGDVFGGIGKIVGDAFNGLLGIIKPPVNAVIDFINRAIDGINGIKIDIPEWARSFFGGASTFSFNLPKIPKLAKGGFVDRPTTALIGEAGPEVVTPLKDFERMMGLDGSRSAGVQVTFNGNVGWDADEVASQIAARQRQAATLAGISSLVGVA